MAYKIIGVTDEQQKLEAEEPIFKETKYKDGWQMKLIKLNENFLNVSVYDESGTVADTKTFNTQSNVETNIFKKYLEWFEDSPDKNIRKMVKMTVRKS